MSPEVQDDVVALAGRMLDASGAKDVDVSWFGGEPLLAPDVIEPLSARLMALAEERGGEYSASIITNGYLLTQDIVDMLAAAKVRSAQVTIGYDATAPPLATTDLERTCTTANAIQTVAIADNSPDTRRNVNTKQAHPSIRRDVLLLSIYAMIISGILFF